MSEQKKVADRSVEELISKFESLYDQAEALRQQLDHVTKKLDSESGTYRAIREDQRSTLRSQNSADS